MPAVREASPDEAPVELERVEVSPGNFIKMSAADKKAHLEREAEAERSRQAWQRTTAGIVDEPAAGSSDAEVLAKYLSKDELVAVAERLEVGTSGSKAKIADRIVGSENGTAEETTPDEGAADDSTPSDATADEPAPEGTPGEPGASGASEPA